MGRGINVDVRAEKYVVSDMNLRPVQNRAAEVGKKVIADMNVVPVITVKRCDDSQVVPMSAQQAGYDSFLSDGGVWLYLYRTSLVLRRSCISSSSSALYKLPSCIFCFSVFMAAPFPILCL